MYKGIYEKINTAMIKEVRNSNNEISSIREESRLIEGYALVFDTDSDNLSGFTERIDRSAL